MSNIVSIVSLVVVGLFSVNAIIYPTFTDKFLGLNSPTILCLYCLFIIIFKIFNRPILPDKILKIINFAFFPIVLIVSTIFFILEKTRYVNYVFQNFHIFPNSFVFIVLLCLVIFVFSHTKYKFVKEKAISIFFFSSFTVLAYLQISKNIIFSNIALEDSFLEYLQFFMVLFAGCYALRVSLIFKNNPTNNKHKSILFLFLSLAMFFIAFEEISWGQRIFGIVTPESMAAINVQKELNFHNLPFFQLDKTFIMYMLIGLYGSFSRIIVEKIFHNNKNCILYTPNKILSPYFFIVFLVYFICYLGNTRFEINSNLTIDLLPWKEISEGYLALGLYIYLFITYKEVVSKFSRIRR